MPSKTSAGNKAVVAYVPALHAGYVSLFAKYPGVRIYVLGKSFIDSFPRLNRDLRALAPHEAVKALCALEFDAKLLELPEATRELSSYASVVLPDEDVSRDFAEKHLTHNNLTFENVFLRWQGRVPDKQKEVNPDRSISTEILDKEFMRQAITEGQKSADWWRQIGAILVIKGKAVFTSHIRYFPSDLALDIFGTPRMNFDFGERPDIYISMHSEADLIAQAARTGISVEGASIYSSTFPCINCAFLIARSGISKLYYSQGYANLDSEELLRSAGVEIIYVET